MKAAPFEYRRAHSAVQAVALLGESDMAKACGGGQSLGPMLNLRLAQVEQVVDLSRIDALTGFSEGADALRIGAAVTHGRIEDGELPDVTRGLLTRVASGIAYRAIRNRGTLGGSLAHADPAADWVNLMPLLDAQILVQGPSGARTVPAAAWMLGAFTTVLRDDELVGAVRIERLSPGARWTYYKVHRKAGEFADALASNREPTTRCFAASGSKIASVVATRNSRLPPA